MAAREKNGVVDRVCSELRSRGALSIPQGRWPFYEHLVATFQILDSWPEKEAVCLAGLLHSAYSTEAFSQALFDPSNRSVMGDLAGIEAERLVNLFGAINRADLFASLEGGLEVIRRTFTCEIGTNL